MVIKPLRNDVVIPGGYGWRKMGQLTESQGISPTQPGTPRLLSEVRKAIHAVAAAPARASH